jgi:signal transduction histidine kinase
MFIVSYFLALYYAKEFTQPILKLVKFLENIDTINIINKKIKITQNNEYGLLYDEINTMLKRIKKSHNELETYKNNLEDMIEEKIEENTKQLNILQHQSKLAQMGEMVGSIAHQWRQPLNELSINIQKLKYDFLDNKVDKNFIENFVLENKQIINFMSKTIDDFRNFFRIDKLKEHFSIKQIINNSLSIQKAQLLNHNIKVDLKGDDFIIYGYKNELQQVILNLMTNAKDILIEKNTQQPQIEIVLKNNTITVKDNGGGIPNNIIDRIFEPYWTTKEQGKGTGMGLYMSKMIIENNFKGKLTAINGLLGAHFIIDLTNTVEQNNDN